MVAAPRRGVRAVTATCAKDASPHPITSARCDGGPLSLGTTARLRRIPIDAKSSNAAGLLDPLGSPAGPPSPPNPESTQHNDVAALPPPGNGRWRATQCAFLVVWLTAWRRLAGGGLALSLDAQLLDVVLRRRPAHNASTALPAASCAFEECACSVTLNSKASLRSLKPPPRKACLPLLSTTRRTK